LTLSLCSVEHKIPWFSPRFVFNLNTNTMVKNNFFRGSASLHLSRKCYRKRYQSFTTNHVTLIRKLERNLLFVCALMDRNDILPNNQIKIKRIFKSLTLFYISFTYDRHGLSLLKKIPRKAITIDIFDSDECFIYFRFKKEDLHQLLILLRFPSFFKLDNRIRMSGEEIFLRGLYELASGETQFKISRLVFGGDNTMQSRAFQGFIHHVYDNFSHLLTNNLRWWYEEGLVSISAFLMESKMKSHVTFNEGIKHCIFLPLLSTIFDRIFNLK
jgi:hypothetical protein